MGKGSPSGPRGILNAELAEIAEKKILCVLCGLCVDRRDVYTPVAMYFLIAATVRSMSTRVL